MQQQIWKFMDQVFEMLLILTGEQDKDDVSINHIL